MSKQIILASGSPRRKALLEKLGLKFKIIQSKYEEDLSLKYPPKKLVQVLALGKAREVESKIMDPRRSLPRTLIRGGDENKRDIIIAADTIVVLDGKILGKPKTSKNAIRMLKKLSGKAHFVHTGLVVLDLEKKKKYQTTVTTALVFRKLSNKEILVYVKSGEPLDKAGAYAIQENAGVFVNKIIGDYNNIVGLPITALVQILKKLKVNI